MSDRESHLPEVSNLPEVYVEDDMFDLGGFLRVFTGAIRHHWVLITVTTVLTLVAATIYVVVFPPTYTVKAQILAERELDPSRDVFYANWQVFRKGDARDEIVLFTSGPVLRRVIQGNDLTYDDVYHPFLKHVSYLWQESLPGRAYKATKDFFFADPATADLTAEQEDLGRTVDGLKAGITIAGEQDSHIATVTGRGPTPEIAAITNSVIDSYLEYRAEQYGDEAQVAFEVLSEEAERAKGELDAIVVRREEFAAEHGLLLELQKQAQDVGQLTNIEVRMSELRAQVAALQASLLEIETQLESEPPEKVLSSVSELNPVRENAKLRHFELRAALIDLRSRYREDSPEVREALYELAAMQDLIDSEPEHVDRSVTTGSNANYQALTASRDQLKSELEGAQAALAATRETAVAMQEQLAALPSVTEQATNLDREYNMVSEKYERLLLRRMEAEVSATAVDAAPASVRVIDYAIPPTSKSWPRLKYLYPGALIIGLFLGIIAAVLRSLTAGRLLRSHVDRGRIGGPVYATIVLGGQTPQLSLVPAGSAEAAAQLSRGNGAPEDRGTP